MPPYISHCYQNCAQQALRSQNQCYNCCNYARCFDGYFLSGCNNRTIQCSPCSPNCKICSSPLSCGQCEQSYCLTGGTMTQCVLCPPDCLSWHYSAGCILWKAPQGCTNWEPRYRVCSQWKNQTNSANSTAQQTISNSSNSSDSSNSSNLSLIIGLATPFSILFIIVIIYMIYKFRQRRQHYQVQQGVTQSSLSSANDCSICLTNLRQGQVITTACAHMFHNNCLTQWRKRNDICPMCRRVI